ncbi:hypothetical protein Mal64_33720 [Pseudobythopirellula maris]|uniref:PEP-CTERM protein-sorting domain-containing protein n=1 Tax=Pseudobythopirellula maris TaxID=2527991 RepID=A0A5C5ZH53_9BACT|nr:hypothetical protein [Pseudobythopirellula maris]TWT86546.1 hypothetical protein Mal64_33720 [Pseudobythopirellula maris]
MKTNWLCGVAAALGLSMTAGAALATIPYTPVTPPGNLALGPGVVAPSDVLGKEYSHDFDESTLGGGGLPDPEQVIAWDGVGGTADGVDFSGSRPNDDTDRQVDAIANHADALFNPLREDLAHLIFSHDDQITVYGGPAGGPSMFAMPSAGPVLLSNGNTIGGAGEVSVERAGAYHPASSQTVWAKQPEVNGMPLPRDVDGVEVWGPEPGLTGDADRYSLELDFETGASIWNASGTPYLSHPMVVSAVESLLGMIPGPAILPYDNQESRNAINIDALMVLDNTGDTERFDEDPAGGSGDTVIFSIRQVVDPMDATGYYATGSELFVLDGLGGVSFLKHGGHVWDKAYALTDLSVTGMTPGGFDYHGVIDINAIEAIAQVPEPAGLVLLVGGFMAMAVTRWRLG